MLEPMKHEISRGREIGKGDMTYDLGQIMEASIKSNTNLGEMYTIRIKSSTQFKPFDPPVVVREVVVLSLISFVFLENCEKEP